MKIAMIHNAIIPPVLYGGTERVIAWLCEELHGLGHSVTLFAKEGSQIPGVQFRPYSEWQTQKSTFDLCHFWSTPSPEPSTPYLVTIEGNGQPGEVFLPNTVFVSKRHAELHQSSRYVYNGLKVSLFPSESERRNYFVFLAKASWNVKNLAGAIQIAKKAAIELHILGSRSYPLKIERLLNPFRKIKYFGMVNDREKSQHLKYAKGLIFPVRWEEPFGIALTEALASGCPVFGTPYGSLPEIVASDVGILSASAQDLIQAIQKHSFSAEKCRKHVEENFSAQKMAQDYLQIYTEVIKNKTLGPAPKTRTDFNPKTLLPWN